MEWKIFLKSTRAEFVPLNDKISHVCSQIVKKLTQYGILFRSLTIYDTDMLFILRCRLVRTNIEKVSAFGVAMMAGLAVGLWRDLARVQTLREVDKVFSFKMNIGTVQKNCRGWKQAVASVLTNK